MKAVLISIRPEWCAKIASGEKKIEVRKSRPKLTPPFKVYIYCTKDAKKQFWTGPKYSYVDDRNHNAFDKCGSGKVIGEFLCNQIIEDHTFGHDEKFYKAACMSACDAAAYAAQSPMYGWRISNLKIYDLPRELTSFVKPLVLEKVQPYTWYVNKERYLTRAPQSWYYVEDARMKRISKDAYYLEIAQAVSQRSTCLKRRYGAVIVKNDEIIATGYNGAPRGETNCCDVGYCKRIDKPSNSGDYSDCHSVHAEQNAIISASRSEMLGATMYLYGEWARATFGEGEQITSVMWEPLEAPDPCPICRRMIANAGIIRVVTLDKCSDNAD